MRVKRGSNRKDRRKKILNLAEGYWGGKSRLHRTAKIQVEKSLQYAYRDRKQRKRHFRSLWITRINAATRLDSDADTAFAPAQIQITDKIPLHDRHAPAFFEVGNGNSGCGLVHEIVGNDCAFRSGHHINRHFSETCAGIADDLKVGCAVAANCGEIAIGNAISSDLNGVCFGNVDSISVLTCPTILGADAFNTIMGNDGAVFAWTRTPYPNSVVAAVMHVVVTDMEAGGIAAEDSGHCGAGNFTVCDLP